MGKKEKLDLNCKLRVKLHKDSVTFNYNIAIPSATQRKNIFLGKTSENPNKMSEIDLSDDLITRFEMFPNFRRPVNNEDRRVGSIKFSSDGERLVAANNHRILELYNCNTGQQVKPFYLFKHGMSVIDYMDANDRILIGSIGATKGDFAIRELDMTKNAFAISYVGHQKPSVSLSVNMEKKLFVSGGHDKTVLLFDFRVPSPQTGLTNLPAVPMVAIHPKTDDLCAVALEDNRIELHDLRFLKAPFTVFKFNSDPMKWTHFKFSPNGDQILISSNTPRIRIINSFNGTPQAILSSKYE